MSYVKSFKELAQTVSSLVCGCKGRHFLQHDKILSQLFLIYNMKNINTHYYIIYREGGGEERKRKLYLGVFDMAMQGHGFE